MTVKVEHKYTRIGVEFSPLKYWYFLYDEQNYKNNEQRFSFINFNVNWNILNKINLFLGPFCSINYMFLDNKILKWNESIFTSGLRFIWSFNAFNNEIFYHFLSSEIGYRNINGINKFYFNFSVDLISLFYLISITYGIGYDSKNINNN